MGAREAIRDAAMHLFGNQGYAGTSMRDIANAVGVLPGSLYAHIQSKEALLVEIVSDGIGRFLDAIQPIVASGDTPADKLRRMIIAHVEVVADNPERSQVVFHQWRFLGPDNLPKALEGRETFERTFRTVFNEGVAAGQFRDNLNVRISVRAILGALNWTPEWLSPEGPLSPSEVGGQMADALLDGITA